MTKDELDAIKARWETSKKESVFLNAYEDFPKVLAEVDRLNAENEKSGELARQVLAMLKNVIGGLEGVIASRATEKNAV